MGCIGAEVVHGEVDLGAIAVDARSREELAETVMLEVDAERL